MTDIDPEDDYPYDATELKIGEFIEFDDGLIGEIIEVDVEFNNVLVRLPEQYLDFNTDPTTEDIEDMVENGFWSADVKMIRNMVEYV